MNICVFAVLVGGMLIADSAVGGGGGVRLEEQEAGYWEACGGLSGYIFREACALLSG